MDILTQNGLVHFNQLLYRLMRKEYGNFPLKKNMQIYEITT